MGIRSALLPLFALLLLAAAGCSANAAAERQMDQFRKDISKMQSDNERLNERVSALEQGGRSDGQSKARKESSAAEAPKLPVVKLAPGEDPDNPSGEAAPEPGGSEDEPTVIRAEGNRQQVIKSGKDKENAREAQREYDAAYELVKKKKYDKALEAMSAFLIRHPGDENADNAMYWRGECFLAKNDYARAAEEFTGLIARFPQGNKVPDALLKLGLSQQKAGDNQKAKEAFDRLRRDFPSSEAARKIPRE